MKSPSARRFILSLTICMAFAAWNGAARAEPAKTESMGYQCRVSVRAEMKGPDCRMALALTRLATAIYLLPPRSRLWTIRLMNA